MKKTDTIREKMKKNYVFLIHYRNPYLYKAGSENYIISQIQELEKQEISTLVIFPVSKQFASVQVKVWGLVYEKEFIGMFTYKDIISFIGKVEKEHICNAVFLHSIIGTDLAELQEIIRFRQHIYIYLHDYCTCCTNYNLLKNDEYYCGDARLTDEKCFDCAYYATSLQRKAEVKLFLKQLQTFTMIAPSETMKKLWSCAYPEYADRVMVIEHKILEGEYKENRELLTEQEKIRVAFVGNGLKIKGWDEWRKATESLFSQGVQLEFYHFGNVSEQRDYITYVPVSILKDGADAMILSLRKYRIHVVVLFSGWPETYSYTYFESLAANAYVIAGEKSGNIANEVRKRKNGIVIENTKKALEETLKDTENLRKMVNRYRSSSPGGPLQLVNNKAYLSLLEEEESTFRYEADNRGKRRRGLTGIMELLYRIRYRIF